MSDAHKNPLEPENPVMVEISKEKLDELLNSKALEVGEKFRIIRSIEIHPGSVISRQYDR